MRNVQVSADGVERQATRTLENLTFPRYDTSRQQGFCMRVIRTEWAATAARFVVRVPVVAPPPLLELGLLLLGQTLVMPRPLL